LAHLHTVASRQHNNQHRLQLAVFVSTSAPDRTMQTRLDLLTRALPQFGGPDKAGIKLPVIDEEKNSFGETLTRALNEVSDARDRSDDLNARFAAGENVELHEVMSATEEAGIALDMLIELRNKAVEAYRTVINMQS
jgi:flagellar hook-basal body complex protein FliE